MKIGVKLSILLVLPLVVLTVAIAYVYQRESHEQMREELSKEGRAIALIAQMACEDYIRDRQFGDLKHLVDRITGYERVFGLRLFGTDEHVIYESTSLDSFPFQHSAELRGVLADRKPRQYTRRFNNESAVGYIYPMTSDDGHLIGAIQVLQLESYMQQDAQRSRKFIVALTTVALIMMIAIVLGVTRLSVTAPVKRLVQSFREVGARERPARVGVRSNDELGWLAREFNGMCERLEEARASLLAEQERRRQTEANLRIADRLASLGRLAAGLAHEIGTPLGVISGRAEALHRAVAGQEAAERNLQIISTQIDRIARTVRDMLDFARMKPQHRVPIDLATALLPVLDLIEPQLKSRRIVLELSIAGALPPLAADPDQLQQVFLNVALNAMDAMEGGGVLRVTATSGHSSPPDSSAPLRPVVRVAFADTGTGIAPENRERVFDPFFTTKEVGRGTGLGLSVSYGIVQEHGGWFDMASEAGVGTSVTVVLPIGEVDGAAANGTEGRKG